MIECTNITFDKNKTAIIKGFAIIFMIILHVFGGSGWYDVDLPMNHNESLISFMGTFKICVGIFVFMVGYGYAFSKGYVRCFVDFVLGYLVSLFLHMDYDSDAV